MAPLAGGGGPGTNGWKVTTRSTEVGSDPAEDLETQVSSCVEGDLLSLELGLRLGLQIAREGRSPPLWGNAC